MLLAEGPTPRPARTTNLLRQLALVTLESGEAIQAHRNLGVFRSEDTRLHQRTPNSRSASAHLR
jgi:hypothetical protein